jgi:hypothetical protein
MGRQKEAMLQMGMQRSLLIIALASGDGWEAQTS